MQVRHDEGVAIRIDPEPCAVVRKVGQPLSLAKIHILGADAVAKAEGNMDGRDSASVWTARRGRRTWHVRTLFAREPGDLTVGQQRQYARCTGPRRGGEEP